MKKTIIFTLLMLMMGFTASATEDGVFMDFHRMSNPSKHTEVNRAPMHLPIEVTYNSETQIITIIGDESIDAEAYLYNSAGEVEDYSMSLNTTLSISTSGIHTIYIQGDGWYAEGNVLI